MDGTKKALVIGAGAAALVGAAVFRQRETDLRGKVVLITGGSRGLGLALARELAAEDCRIAVCARDPQELRAVRDDPALRGRVTTFECDVSRQDQVESMIRVAIGRLGRIDVLVNNAGEIEVGPVEAMSIQDFREAMDTMFWGVVYPSLAVMPEMTRRRSGHIVTITSIGGKVAVPHLLPYTCAKFAAVGFSEGLHAELAKTRVKVTTVAPGLMRTGSYRNAWFKGNTDREAAWFSLGATMPGVSINAMRAARQVVTAIKRGRSETILSLPAKLLALTHGVFPGTTSDILGLVNRWILPDPKDRPSFRRKGFESETPATLSFLTSLSRAAERANNQL